MEFLVVIAVFAYIFYLKHYADLRTRSEKEEAALEEGIRLYRDGSIPAAFRYFDQKITGRPNASVAYLYRGLCYKAMHDPEAATRDFQTGLSYDDQVYRLHLESGRLLLEQGEAQQALTTLSRAIQFAGEQDPEPYLLRARAYRALGDEHAADDDQRHAVTLQTSPGQDKNGTQTSKAPLLDRRLLINLVMVAGTSAILVAVIKDAESIHLPYLVAVGSAISIGFAEPHRGWLLALAQCALMVAGYFLFTDPPATGGEQELENFSLYGSMILTLAASFLGAFLKRAINMG